MDELLLLAWKIPLFADWKMLWKEKKKEIQGIFYLFIFFFWNGCYYYYYYYYYIKSEQWPDLGRAYVFFQSLSLSPSLIEKHLYIIYYKALRMDDVAWDTRPRSFFFFFLLSLFSLLFDFVVNKSTENGAMKLESYFHQFLLFLESNG